MTAPTLDRKRTFKEKRGGKQKKKRTPLKSKGRVCELKKGVLTEAAARPVRKEVATDTRLERKREKKTGDDGREKGQLQLST